MAIKIFTAGNCSKNTKSSFLKLIKHGLCGQEIEFVRQVYLSRKQANNLGKFAKSLGIMLSVHASYYINLNSKESYKVTASKKRILDACEKGHYLGAENIVFHPGYYGKKSPEETYKKIKQEIIEIQHTIQKNKWRVRLCPEITGKKSQFGSLFELLKLKKQINCRICVDFCHILARDGTIDYKKVLKKLPQSFHSHFSGVEYSEKGERKHLLIDEADFEKLAKEIILQKKDATIVCESPQPFSDALKMKKIVKDMQQRNFLSFFRS
ncbi:TIM barrel protein [Candidatus Woesearchaeota archaeon]|nr:TIM barrel protein [Candidatus Woesearchaeota archaeon]